MSLTGVLRTGVSGMNAQTNRISTVAENIQNASTTGYKRTSTEFSSLLLESSGTGNYNSGAVETTVRRSIGEEGPTSFTTSDTDLAINGNGFFLVRDGGGGQFLTRAGNFVKDGTTGNLVNAGGFTLLGYKLNPDGTLPANPALTEIKSGATQLMARPSSTMTLQGNLSPADPALGSGGSATKVIAYSITSFGTGPVVSASDAPPNGTTFTTKTTEKIYDPAGNEIPIDGYLVRTSPSTHSLVIYDGSNPGSFPSAPLKKIDNIPAGPPGTTVLSSMTMPSGQSVDIGVAILPPAAAGAPGFDATAYGGSPATASNPADFSTWTSVSVYDSFGKQRQIDIYATKISEGHWTIRFFDASASGSFPASPLAPDTSMSFNSRGVLVSDPKTSIALASGEKIVVDLSSLTQVAAPYSLTGVADGSAPTSSTGVAFGDDGTVYTIYADGTRAATYKVPIADVSSPDQLQPRAGNVFEATAGSGNIELGFAQQNGLGILKSKALEQSNVDVATELTTMIESQSIYTANSKTFMAGKELLDTLMQLKR